MADSLLLATRKGLLTLGRANGGWRVTDSAFPGVPVTSVLHDARDGAVFAALKHGHFGAKLHRSDDGGRSWREIATPAFPGSAAGAPSLFQGLDARGGRRARTDLGRRHSGRPVSLR